MRRYEILGAFLGWLGTVNQILIASYLLAVYQAFSAISSMEKLGFQVYLAAILLVLSAAALACGSFLLWKGKWRAGGMINLGAGTLISVPTYIYFALLSEPTFLGWLGLLGVFLLTPAIFSGTIGILLSSLHPRR
jgi:chromate transport protein ChrA